MRQALTDMLVDQGASLVGYANLGSLNGEGTRGFPSAVVIALALDHRIIARIPTGPHVEYSYEYMRANEKLDQLGTAAEAWLRERDMDAQAITSGHQTYDQVSFATPLPFKTVARLAGLGWVGKNALLVTREFGCAQRFTVVLTRAPLSPSPSRPMPQCKNCTCCQAACPGGAVHGNAWQPGVGRDHLVDVGVCHATTDRRGMHLSVRKVTCGLCIAACPFTQAYLTRCARASPIIPKETGQSPP